MPRPTLYFVRHGETDWNAERRLQGQHDIPLNALGRTQASRCGEILRDLFARDGGCGRRVRLRRRARSAARARPWSGCARGSASIPNATAPTPG